MIERHIGKIIFIIICFIVVLIVINSKIFEKKGTTIIKPQELESEVYSSNKIIKKIFPNFFFVIMKCLIAKLYVHE